MPELTRQYMTEFDANELEYIIRRDQALSHLISLQQRVHRMVGDKTRGFGSSRWVLTDGQAEELLAQQAAGTDEHELSTGMRPSEMVALLAEARELVNILNAAIEGAENQFRSLGGWTRYFICTNSDGHIHSSLRGCKTVHWDTGMAWMTQYSGLTVDDAIHGTGSFDGLGETLCSVCFPDAPVEWCRTRSEVTRAEREAARDAKNAARDAKNAAKNLAEPFRTWDGDRITTVAAAKGVVRRPAETQAELEWNLQDSARARWQDQESYDAFIARLRHRLEMEQADAVRLSFILIEREAAAPGTGWSQEAQDKALADALKRNRRIWFK